MHTARPIQLLALAILYCSTVAASAAELSFRPQEISNHLGIGYATRAIDMNDDGRPDVLVVDKERVIWFENPSWEMHTIIENQTKPDNVCIAPYDIDGDGKLDFALGADWRPTDTRTSGSIQWLERPKNADDKWIVHPIGTEPTVHRMQWADLDGDGRGELIVVPLQGAGTSAPNWDQHGVRILAYKIPRDPAKDTWQPQVLNDELHVTHNFLPTDLDRDGHIDVLVASFEGVSWLKPSPGGAWKRVQLGAGNQETSPNRGSSEIKHGTLAGGADYLATIEPWHGFQVVVYTRPESAKEHAPEAAGPWARHVLDDELLWGHAVWCADLDGDGDQELIVGVRDTKDTEHPCGLRIYDPSERAGSVWNRHIVDPGGVAIEDLTVADLNADGKLDIIAVGRATKNVRIYWNQSK